MNFVDLMYFWLYVSLILLDWFCLNFYKFRSIKELIVSIVFFINKICCYLCCFISSFFFCWVNFLFVRIFWLWSLFNFIICFSNLLFGVEGVFFVIGVGVVDFNFSFLEVFCVFSFNFGCWYLLFIKVWKVGWECKKVRVLWLWIFFIWLKLYFIVFFRCWNVSCLFFSME